MNIMEHKNVIQNFPYKTSWYLICMQLPIFSERFVGHTVTCERVDRQLTPVLWPLLSAIWPLPRKYQRRWKYTTRPMVFTKTPMVERIFVALFLMCYSAISITSMPILGHFYRNVLVQSLNGTLIFINILNESFCVSYIFRFPFYSGARTYMLVIYKELKYLPWTPEAKYW